MRNALLAAILLSSSTALANPLQPLSDPRDEIEIEGPRVLDFNILLAYLTNAYDRNVAWRFNARNQNQINGFDKEAGSVLK